LQIKFVGINTWREFRSGQVQHSSRSGTSWPWSTENGSDASRTQVWWYTAAACWEALLYQGTQQWFHSIFTVCQTSQEI